MRFRAPRSGSNGLYGGSGSRPSTRAWSPSRKRADEETPGVQPKYHKLRLRRARHKPTRIPLSTKIVLVALTLCALAIAGRLLRLIG